MPEGLHRFVEQHAGAGETHYLADALAHLGPIAVDATFAARRLGVAKRATRKPLTGILEQRTAVGAQFGIVFLVAAVHADHYANNVLFLFDARHRYSSKWMASINLRIVAGSPEYFPLSSLSLHVSQ